MKLFSHRHSQSRHQQPKEEAVRIAVVDTETTGLYNSDRIVEVGIVLLDPYTGAIVDEFETLVNPGRDVGPSRIHGITASMVTAAPHFDEIVSDIADRINGSILSAHNLSFDARMLSLEFSRTGATFEPGRGLCTLTMSQMRLDLACEEYGIKRKTAHRALDDARAASQLLMITLDSNAMSAISLGCEPARISLPPISLTTHGVPITRDDVPQEREVSHLQREHRIELACDDPALLPYLDLLGMALDDLVLTEQEIHELRDEAVRLGLDSNQIGLAHELAYASLAANIELGNLMVERQLLNVLAPRLRIQKQEETESPAGHRSFEMIPAVCFTGDIFIRGRFVEREQLEELALAAGWGVEPTVTKKRCTLLVGDINSHSLKMQKARQFGIEIASGNQFAALIGLLSLPSDGMVPPRDPSTVPPIGEQSDELDPLRAESINAPLP